MALHYEIQSLSRLNRKLDVRKPVNFNAEPMNTIQLESEQIAPSKIVCIGRNYLEHIRELGNETPDDMVIFNKPNSSI